MDRERLTVYPRIFATLYVGIGGWWLLSGVGLLDRAGTPIGADFLTFYAASVLARAGEAAACWDVYRLHDAERAVIGAWTPVYAWHYPPGFLLAVLPLSVVPYLAAFGLWVTAGLAAFVAVARRLAPDPATIGLALAFPGTFQNVFQGQNGLYTAALLGGGLLLVETRPVLGGAVLGLLSVKPHLAPVVGVALLAGRRWPALGAFVGSAALLAAVSYGVLGAEAWTAFARNMPFALRVLEEGALPWNRIPTVEAGALMLHAPVGVARGLQGLAALGALGVVGALWATKASWEARAAGVAAAAMLVTPFAFDYDLAVYAVPVALLARHDARLAAVAWLTPLFAPMIAGWTSVQLGPFVSAWILAVAWRRR